MARYTKEQLQRALDTTPNMIDGVRWYFEAFIEDRLPQYYLAILKTYRYEYSSELPEPEVSRNHPDYTSLRLQFREENPKMKCRANVILGIGLNINAIVKDDVLTMPPYPELAKSYSKRDWNTFRGSKGEFWTTQEEMNFINFTLDTFIVGLEELF